MNHIRKAHLEIAEIDEQVYLAAVEAANELYPDRATWRLGWSAPAGMTAAEKLSDVSGAKVRWGFLGTYRHSLLDSRGRANYGLVIMGRNGRYVPLECN